LTSRDNSSFYHLGVIPNAIKKFPHLAITHCTNCGKIFMQITALIQMANFIYKTFRDHFFKTICDALMQHRAITRRYSKLANLITLGKRTLRSLRVLQLTQLRHGFAADTKDFKCAAQTLGMVGMNFRSRLRIDFSELLMDIGPAKFRSISFY